MTDRNPTTIRAVRFVAAAAVVWAHSFESPEFVGSEYTFPRFAVRFFAAASMLAAGRAAARQNRPTLTAYAVERFVWLYVPFLAWSVIYGAVRASYPGLSPDIYSFEIGWSLLRVGTSYHLWFLPFILLVSVGAYGFLLAFDRLTGCRLEDRVISAVGLAAMGAWFGLVSPPAWLEGEHPYHAIMDATPAACWGLALAVAMARPGSQRRVPKALGWIGLVVVVAVAGWLALNGRDRLAENLCGFAALVFCMGCPAAVRIRTLGWLGSMSFGIYLNHVLFVELYQKLGRDYCYSVSDPKTDLAIFAAALGSSVVTTWSLRRLGLRWLSGC